MITQFKIFERDGIFQNPQVGHPDYNNWDYQYYIAIYRCDCESDDDMIMRAKLLKSFLKVDYKICYIDPVAFPDSSECVVFLLKEKIADIKFPYPTEGTAKNAEHDFTLRVRDLKNWDIVEQTEIPDNDIDQFFTAKKYNL